jgi:hypothetical protein
MRYNLKHQSNHSQPKGQDSTHILNPKAKKKKTKNKSMQKTKNNKIPQEATSKEHNIIDIPRKHDLVLEIHASMSEKHTLAHETPKPPK